MGSASGSLTPYKRRRPVPALVLFAVLLVSSVFVWVKVLGSASDVDAAIRCNAPGNVTATSATTGADPAAGQEQTAPPPALGTVLEHDALDRAEPGAGRRRELQGRQRLDAAQPRQGRRDDVHRAGPEAGGRAWQRPDLPGGRHELPRPDPLRRARRVGGEDAVAAGAVPRSSCATTARTPPSTSRSARSSTRSSRTATPARCSTSSRSGRSSSRSSQGGQVATAAPPTLNADNLAGARDVSC